MRRVGQLSKQHWEEGEAVAAAAAAAPNGLEPVQSGGGLACELPPAGSSVPVYVMLPLGTVNAEGVFIYGNSTWFTKSLETLKETGIRGVAVDVWWGAVERRPRQYCWSGYRQLFEIVRKMGLRLQAGEADPDIFFTDRPRRTPGQRNRECLTLFADDEPGLLKGRSPLQCYTDFMRAFRDEFAVELGGLVEEVVVGAGPCGELRYPSYPEANGWRFPGLGEFQCYDRRALASLAATARAAGHPEWGHSGPQDTGSYNASPEETGFFSSWGGVWDSPYGRFFLEWYSDALMEHGERLLAAATSVFNLHREGPGPRMVLAPPPRAAPPPGGRSFSLPNLSSVALPSPRVEPGGGGAADPPAAMATQAAAAAAAQQQQLAALYARRSTSGGGVPPSPSVEMFDSGPASAAVSEAASSPPSTPSHQALEAHSTASRPAVAPPAGGQQQQGGSGLPPAAAWPPAASVPPLSPLGVNRALQRSLPSWGCLRSTKSDGSEEAWAGGAVALAPAGARRPRRPLARPPVELSLKVAGVHWWYRTRSHAGELTAGYYNSEGRDGYTPIIDLCRRYGASLTLTCVEMCDSQHPPEALCGPEGLLRQVRESAARAGVPVAGENALPCFMPAAIDEVALQRIVYNTQPWGTPLQQGSSGDDATSFGALASPSELIAIAQAAVPSSGPPPGAAAAGSGGGNGGGGEGPEGAGAATSAAAGRPPAGEAAAAAGGGGGGGPPPRSAELPPLRAFTFLRLSNEMMSPAYQESWRMFMQAMRRNAQQFRTSRSWRRSLGLEAVHESVRVLWHCLDSVSQCAAGGGMPAPPAPLPPACEDGTPFCSSVRALAARFEQADQSDELFGTRRFDPPREEGPAALRAALDLAPDAPLAEGDCALLRWPAMPVVLSATSNPWVKKWVLSGNSGCVALASSIRTLYVLGAGQTIYCCDADVAAAVVDADAAAPAAADAQSCCVRLSFGSDGWLTLRAPRAALAEEVAGAVGARAARRAALRRV
eukprot:scaffold7.g3737.t1